MENESSSHTRELRQDIINRFPRLNHIWTNLADPALSSSQLQEIVQNFNSGVVFEGSPVTSADFQIDLPNGQVVEIQWDSNNAENYKLHFFESSG